MMSQTTDTTETNCPECASRQKAARDEEAQREYWSLISHANELFSTQGKLIDMANSAGCISLGRLTQGGDDTALLLNLVRNIDLKCEAGIEQFAAEVRGKHPQLSGAILLRLKLSQRGGSITPEVGITADGDQYSQAVATINLHEVDAETWGQFVALRDTLADMVGPPATFGPPDDNIPF